MLLCFFGVLFHELIHAAGGIDKFLLSGKKWMARRTYLYPDIGFGGTRMDGIAAGTHNYAILILGMDLVFHFMLL
jgi:hypothetical protein